MEMSIIRRTAYLRAFNSSLFFTSSKLIVFLTFVIYVLTGNILTSDAVRLKFLPMQYNPIEYQDWLFILGFSDRVALQQHSFSFD